MIESGQQRDVVTPFLEWDLPETSSGDDHIEIHTSDRILFKRCRRKWNWQSSMRENLLPIGQAVAPLWFGTGWHFLMEDYHGYQKYPTVDHAIVAFKDAHNARELPDDPRALLDLMAGMAHYYTEDWLTYHPEPYKTLWVSGIPQVEVDIDIDITDRLHTRCWDRYGDSDWLEGVLQGRPVIYRMTLDRVAIDEHDLVYVIDYKTARQVDTNKLSNDPQVSAYFWGAAEFYGDRLGGVVWQQHLKSFPEDPEWLHSSQRFSMNRQQCRSTYPLYRKALKEKYGRIPAQYVEFLDWLAEQQGDWGDRFVRRDIIRRNPHARRAEEQKILDEVLDMLDPGLPLYPNPTRDCTWDCPFKDPCIAMDDGSDMDFLLKTSYEKWKGYKQDWKKRVILPDGSRYA